MKPATGSQTSHQQHHRAPVAGDHRRPASFGEFAAPGAIDSLDSLVAERDRYRDVLVAIVENWKVHTVPAGKCVRCIAMDALWMPVDDAR